MPARTKPASSARLAETAAQRCIAMRIKRLNRLITRRYDEALRPHGLTVGQLNLLAVVARMGQATPVELGKFLDLEKSTLSRNLRLLNTQGLLRSVAASTPAGQVIELSAKGESLFIKAMQSWQQVQQRLERALDTDTVAVLDRLSEAVRQA
jgi:DNA-binding MarR family transcriptional regulator